MLNRLNFIDYVRGVAAILVLTSHAFEIYIENWNHTFEYFNLGQTGVVAFFLVSGYIIPFSMEKINKPSDFIRGRIFRIYPLYLFVFLLGFFSSILNLYRPPHPGTDIYIIILSHLFFVQDLIVSPNYVQGNWTLFLEAIWYAFFSILFFTKFSKKINLVYFSFNLALLALVLISIYSGSRIPYGKLCFISVCLIGFLCYSFQSKNISFNVYTLHLSVTLSVLYISLFVIFSYFTNDQFYFQCVFISWSAGFIIFFALALFPLNNSIVTSCLSFLGKISYSVYLIHPLVLYCTLPYIQNYEPIFKILICFSVTLVSAYLTYHYIELPATKFNKKRLNASSKN